MSTVKTAISVQESLFERAETLARQLLDAINRSLEGEPGSDEAQSVRRMQGIQRRRVGGQW